nr:helix-turn-helix domain-containing protein [Pacificibacter marinus]
MRWLEVFLAISVILFGDRRQDKRQEWLKRRVTKNDGKLQKYSAPALEKGLDILEFLSLIDFKPTLSEVAAGIDRSKSEIFRMMIVLEERGYIQRFDRDTFTLTDRMSVIGSPRSFNSRLAEIASPYLKQLSSDTGLSTHLSVLDENQMLVIANNDAEKSYGLSLQVGFRTDLAGSGTAACLLAGQQDKSTETLQQADLKQLKTLEGQFNTQGYILSPNPNVHSVLELSAPVCISEPRIPIAAITLALFETAVRPNTVPDIATHLTSAVQALGRRIDISMPSLTYKTSASKA